MGIIENKKRGLDIEQREYIKHHLKTSLNFFSDSWIEPHQRNNDPYDYVLKIKQNGKVYTKYVEIKSGNASLSQREKEFKSEHPRSYIIIRCDADSEFHDFKEGIRSLFSKSDWVDFLNFRF